LPVLQNPVVRLTSSGLFVIDAVMQSQQSNAKRVPGLLSGAEVKAADGGLTTPTLRGYLWLGQLAKAADFGDDLFPVHALSITGNCYLSNAFLLSVFRNINL
jgi:hypothetical protein